MIHSRNHPENSEKKLSAKQLSFLQEVFPATDLYCLPT